MVSFALMRPHKKDQILGGNFCENLNLLLILEKWATDPCTNRNWPGNIFWRKRLPSQRESDSSLGSSRIMGQLSGLLPWVATLSDGQNLSPCLQTQSPKSRLATRIAARKKARRLNHTSRDWPSSLIKNSRGSAPRRSAHSSRNQLLVL